MAKGIVFRVRKKYFDDIVAGTKTVEYRRDGESWRKRAFGGYKFPPDVREVRSIEFLGGACHR